MERAKQTILCFVPKIPKRGPKWEESSFVWKGAVVLLLTAHPAIYTLIWALSLSILPELKCYLNWLAAGRSVYLKYGAFGVRIQNVALLLDLSETIGYASITLQDKMMESVIQKPSQSTLSGLARGKVLTGWIVPVVCMVLTWGKNKSPRGVLTWVLKFYPDLKAEVDESPFLQGRLLPAQIAILFIIGNPIVLVIYLGHSIWRYWKTSRSQGGISLTGEEELAVESSRSGEIEKMAMEAQSSETTQMV